MNELEEIKKLKKLLDDGIINEIEFKQEKAKLIGLEIKEEIDTDNNVNENIGILKNEQEDEEYYLQEKIKAKAMLDAQEEFKQEKSREAKKKSKELVKSIAIKIKNIILWILTIILWIFSIGSIGTSSKSGFIYVPIGIITIIQGCMLCPTLTEYTTRYKFYTKYKKIIFVLTILAFIVLCCNFPSN